MDQFLSAREREQKVIKKFSIALIIPYEKYNVVCLDELMPVHLLQKSKCVTLTATIMHCSQT